jgi:hypothetical protein
MIQYHAAMPRLLAEMPIADAVLRSEAPNQLLASNGGTPNHSIS